MAVREQTLEAAARARPLFVENGWGYLGRPEPPEVEKMARLIEDLLVAVSPDTTYVRCGRFVVIPDDDSAIVAVELGRVDL